MKDDLFISCERKNMYMIHILKGSDSLERLGYLATPFPRYPLTHISYPFATMVSVRKAISEKVNPWVDCIASGYEWICPDCKKLNQLPTWTEEVQCLGCQGFYNLNSPEHTYE
jgi:hypothetical protein